MTQGSSTRRSRPYVKRKPDKYIEVWIGRVADYIRTMDEFSFEPDKIHYYKVSHVAEWLDERYVVYRGFKPLFKKIIVGKCLKQLGFEKHAYGEQGWIYKRKEASCG